MMIMIMMMMTIIIIIIIKVTLLVKIEIMRSILTQGQKSPTKFPSDSWSSFARISVYLRAVSTKPTRKSLPHCTAVQSSCYNEGDEPGETAISAR
jgi:hypothetical protein